MIHVFFAGGSTASSQREQFVFYCDCNYKVLYLSLGSPNTVADGLRIGLGKRTWPIIRDNVTDVITVTEEEIISAMRLVWERMKLMIESSAAVGVAAVLSEKFKALPAQDLKNVGVIFCGGNVDLDNLPWKK